MAILLPEDFGSAEFYERRKNVIQRNISNIRNEENLSILFNDLLRASESLRDYLWVNDDDAVETAEIAINILPSEMVLSSLEWAIQDFWQRQPGWPDLFVYKGNEYKFVEVKSPHDKLSQEQMKWFEWASEQDIPSEILRVVKSKGTHN